jgi:hypothetical protein
MAAEVRRSQMRATRLRNQSRVCIVGPPGEPRLEVYRRGRRFFRDGVEKFFDGEWGGEYTARLGMRRAIVGI